MNFRTKPSGIHATFSFDCPRCRQEATVTGGRVDPHDCTPQRPVTLAQIQAALARKNPGI